MLASTSRTAASLAWQTSAGAPSKMAMVGRRSLLAARPFSQSVAAREAAPTAAIDESGARLSWERYLQLRKQRRIAGLVTTVPTTALAAIASGSYFLTQEIDPTSTPIAGIDPFYVYMLATMGCTGLGYLVGPSFGSTVWSLFHRKQQKQIEQKDTKFFQHILRNRVDPSRQTMQNRLPDYYGEKIGSVREYRQWLRDQAIFRRKAAHGVEDDEKGSQSL